MTKDPIHASMLRAQNKKRLLKEETAAKERNFYKQTFSWQGEIPQEPAPLPEPMIVEPPVVLKWYQRFWSWIKRLFKRNR